MSTGVPVGVVKLLVETACNISAFSAYILLFETLALHRQNSVMFTITANRSAELEVGQVLVDKELSLDCMYRLYCNITSFTCFSGKGR